MSQYLKDNLILGDSLENFFGWITLVVANWDETAVKLKCRKNHWEYENKQYTIEKSVESATRNAKKNF